MCLFLIVQLTNYFSRTDKWEDMHYRKPVTLYYNFRFFLCSAGPNFYIDFSIYLHSNPVESERPSALSYADQV